LQSLDLSACSILEVKAWVCLMHGIVVRTITRRDGTLCVELWGIMACEGVSCEEAETWQGVDSASPSQKAFRLAWSLLGPPPLDRVVYQVSSLHMRM